MDALADDLEGIEDSEYVEAPEGQDPDDDPKEATMNWDEDENIRSNKSE